jgi:hypothetical protein
MSEEVVVLSTVPPAIGDYGKLLASVPPTVLGALVGRETLSGAKLEPRRSRGGNAHALRERELVYERGRTRRRWRRIGLLKKSGRQNRRTDATSSRGALLREKSDDPCVNDLGNLFHSVRNVGLSQFAAAFCVPSLNGVENIEVLCEGVVTALFEVNPADEMDAGVDAVHRANHFVVAR